MAEECEDKYAVVHYDLAVAKPAMQIQYQESPRINNIFICFSSFQIELAFFGAIGHILAESGGLHILVDTGVLVEGSMNGLISGKHFNRCKRIHPLLAFAFRILHTGKFFRDYGNMPHDLPVTLSGIHSHPNPAALEAAERRDNYQDFFKNYDEFCEKTKAGDHGATARFWMMYMEPCGVGHITKNSTNVFSECRKRRQKETGRGDWESPPL